MSIGFPVADGSGNGTSASDMRKIVSSHWASHGVIGGAGVSTSSSGLTYNVAAGTAVASRGTSYGVVEFLVPAGSVTTDAGPSSGSRIDVVWAKPNDPSQGDANADVVLGVTKGAAASTPSKPTIPTGAVELRTFLVPQGASKTSQATVSGSVNYAIPYGASLGVLHSAVNAYDGKADESTTTWHTEGNGSFYLPVDSRVRLEMWMCLSSRQGGSSVDDPNKGSINFNFNVDGQAVFQTEIGYSTVWETKYMSVELELPAGPHSVSYATKMAWGWTAWYHYGAGAAIGRRFVVTHLGVAK
ncbi:hypothetical protein [Pseudoclavibacter sp. CFCC 11306]|uniref:hypothetical protein n=1 Tax=Pseudoclavibacter sp. CFCC 11306 TaxID=1564493 RepID=UPI001301909C|nr:hypothetical protein [Pseudoclavibacter sp. CFCC 11306]KAB1659017.1 hypothetical protein F8O09_05480 [Pseudoclavibacter sp. CFCC 11306]